MKIFFFGNVNNYPLILAKELKKKGHEVTVFIESDKPLFRPENRLKEIKGNYPNWIIDISFLRELNIFLRFKKFRKIIKNYGSPDLIILNGSVGSYFVNIFKCKKFFLATGSDIAELCSYRSVINPLIEKFKRNKFLAGGKLFLRKILLIRRQRNIFQSCIGFSFFDEGIFPETDKIINSLKISPKRFNFRLADLSDDLYSKIKPKIYNNLEIIKIVCLSRINWSESFKRNSFSSKLHDKNIQILIEGVAKYIHQNQGNIELTLFKKGNQIAKTKKLINDLKIDKYVIWENEVDQIKLADFYNYADLVADQFNPSSVMGTAALNAMLSSRPILTNNISPSCIINKKYKNPNKNILNSDELANYLKEISKNPKNLEQIARESKDFVLNNHNPNVIADMILDFVSEKFKVS